MLSFHRAALLLFGPTLLATASSCRTADNTYAPPPPPEVTVMRPLERPVVEYLEETGETEAVERAEVRARVRGFIEGVEFEPGQRVEKGTLLYRIEDDEYVAAEKLAAAELSATEAAISVADSAVSTAQAEVNRAASELKRQQSLLEQNATSQTEYDEAVAADEAARANLEAAQAQVEAAKASKQKAEAALADARLNLGYTEVRAPITGQVTATQVKLGNLVDVGTPLAAVVSDRQIYANFNISDRQLLRFLRANEASESAASTSGDEGEKRWRNRPVELRRELDRGFPFRGVLDYVDQEGVEAGTGTLRMRARFDNEDGRLLPGLFVQVRIPIGKPKPSLLVPEQAVQQDRLGRYVWLVGDGDEAERQGVELGARRNGWAVIAKGLQPDDVLIVEGLQRVAAGSAVAPEAKEYPESFDPMTDGELLASDTTAD